MALQNPSFEDETPGSPGLAEHWTLEVTGSDEEAADYDDGSGTPPFESFRGGWDGNEAFTFAFASPEDPGELEAAIFEAGIAQETVEDFEEGWGNTPFFIEMGVASPASYDGNTPIDSGIGPWSVALGNTLDITTDDGSASSDPVSALEANLIADDLPSIDFDAGGETVRIHYNGRGFVAVTFTPAHTTVSDVAAYINTQATIQGANGELVAGTTDPGGGDVLFIDSLIEGYGSEIRLENVSHPDTWQRLGFSASQVADGIKGSGNVYLVDEATAADIVALVSNAAIATINSGAVETPDGRVRVWSDPGGTVRIDSSGVLGTALGFVLDTPTGPAGSAESTEDFEEGYENAIVPNDGNLIASGGAETWTPAAPLYGSTTDDQLDPDGGTDAFLLTDFTTLGDRTWTGDQTGIAGGRLRCRLSVKKRETAPNFCAIAINFNSGGTQDIRIYFDQRTGRVAVSVASMLEEVTIAEKVPGWWRIDLLTKPAGVGDVGFELTAAAGKVEAFPNASPAVGTANTGITVASPRIVEQGAALEGFALSWADVNSVTAFYDTGASNHEDFEDGWLNDAFQFVMGAVTSTLYDTGSGGASEDREDFEEVLAPFVVAVADESTDTFTKAGHGLGAGQIVRLHAEGGTLPAGLSEGTDYYVVSPATDTFQLSATFAGTPIDFTTPGTGQLTVTPPGSVFWIDIMTTL